MCAMQAVMGILGAGMSIANSMAENKAANQKGKIARATAQREFAINSASDQAKVEETRQDVSKSGVANAVMASQAQGAALAQFGASGVGGGALDSVVNEYARQQGQASGDLGQTLRFAGQNAQIQQRANWESTVNKARIENPKRKLGGLQIATAVMAGLNGAMG